MKNIALLCLCLLGCQAVHPDETGTDALTVSPPAGLAFTPLPTPLAGVCSSSLAVQLVDAAGQPVNASAPVPFTLDSDAEVGGKVLWFSDAKCTARVTGSTIATGQSQSPKLFLMRPVASAIRNVAPSLTALTVTAHAGGSLRDANGAATLLRNPALSTVWDSPNIPAGKSTGVINVKAPPYNAYGDGQHDDTQALLAAIRANVPVNDVHKRDHMLFFPSGVYLVKSPLLWANAQGVWSPELEVQGENNSDTVLKLADQLYTGKCDPGAGPQHAVLYTASDPSCAGTGSDGGGECAFRNHIRNVTVDVGKKNPAAIGIDYAGSNNSRLSEVNIVSGDGAGCVGLSNYRNVNGPAYLARLFIQGFDTGILVGGQPIQHSNAFLTYEHLWLVDQHQVGLSIPYNGWAPIRDLRSDNAVPAVSILGGGSQFALVDGVFNGGSKSSAAVVIQSDANGVPGAFVRHCTESGYGALISVDGQSPPPAREWTSDKPLSMPGASQATSLDLAVEETPAFADDTRDGTDYSSWSFAQSHCGNDDIHCDSTADLQAAVDAATSTVVLPWGFYALTQPLRVGVAGHGLGVRRVLSLGAHLTVYKDSNGAPEEGQVALELGDTTFGTLWVDDLLFPYSPGVDHFGSSQYPFPDPRFIPVVNNAAAATRVVLRNLDNITYLDRNNAPSHGEVFIESVAYGPFIFENQRAWARSLDPEVGVASTTFLDCYSLPHDYLQQGTTHLQVTGGGAQLWTLGLKTENREFPANACSGWQGLPSNEIVDVDLGATVELVGATINNNKSEATPAAMTVHSGRLSLEAYATKVFNYDYDIAIEQTLRGGQNFDVMRASDCPNGSLVCAYPRLKGSAIPLYIGF